jgi:hypothetical protein
MPKPPSFNTLPHDAFSVPCKIVRFRCSGKCQCSHKVIKVFGKIVFAVRSSERVDLFFSTFYLIQRVCV